MARCSATWQSAKAVPAPIAMPRATRALRPYVLAERPLTSWIRHWTVIRRPRAFTPAEARTETPRRAKHPETGVEMSRRIVGMVMLLQGSADVPPCTPHTFLMMGRRAFLEQVLPEPSMRRPGCAGRKGADTNAYRMERPPLC